MNSTQILDREFFEIRAKILELAASFDRLDRADGSISDDRRLQLLHQALDAVQQAGPNRAEQVQLIFSREYDEQWLAKFELKPGR